MKNKSIIVGDVLIKRGDIPGYFTRDFWDAYRLWEDWTMFGLPHGKGPLNESACTIAIIKAFQKEYIKVQAEVNEKASKKAIKNGNNKR